MLCSADSNVAVDPHYFGRSEKPPDSMQAVGARHRSIKCINPNLFSVHPLY